MLVIITTFEIMITKLNSYQLKTSTEITVVFSVITISTTTITPLGFIFHI
jgi:hypothetical protein